MNLLLRTIKNSSAAAFCIEDQYGNQYHINVDARHGLLLGFASTDPNVCSTTYWDVFGSFTPVPGAIKYELTVLNPLGDNGVCEYSYKIMGQWPSGDWYYVTPPVYEDGQAFVWKSCTLPQSAFEAPALSGRGQRR